MGTGLTNEKSRKLHIYNCEQYLSKPFWITCEFQPMSSKPQILQRRLVATLKSICARRRDGWKKSFKERITKLFFRFILF